ncbi:MAG: zinc metallopeptidase [Firmicutes bacterium]|nr:zinc metallopeptidase [Bacillota bacterium]
MDLLLIAVIIIVPLIADLNVKGTYKKYLKVKNQGNLSGQEIARQILDHNGLTDVYVVETSGFLSDHYDPKRKTVRLSKAVFEGETVAAIAIAAHECGHAIQDKEGYWFMRLRSAIYPIVNIATSVSYYIILIGFLFQILDMVYLGIAFTTLGLIFQLVTLPVEFNASSRAKEELIKLRIVQDSETTGISKVLTSAALTYVAGVLASAVQILRLILAVKNND